MIDGKYTIGDVYFKRMSEDESIKTFKDDGYDGWETRAQRYRQLPSDGLFATEPSIHYVAFNRRSDKPMGVIGYAPYKGFLLGAGVHVRKDEEGKSLVVVLLEKLLALKGSRILVASFANEIAYANYYKLGFRPIDEVSLPKEVLEELEEASRKGSKGSLQKYYVHAPMWWAVLKVE